jgi:tetratricopeptide (TPR) repeat protein
LLEFHAGRYEAALQLFDQSVAADAKDAYARYYRGVTHGRLGNHAAAVDDLSAALNMRPDLPHGSLELGAALIKAERWAEAIPSLEKARQTPADRAKASFYLGLAQERLARLEEARASLAEVESDPALRVAARYHLGVIEYRLREWQKAGEHFSFVAAASPDSEMGKEAGAFLAKMRDERRRPYVLFGEVGFQYDSNVSLAPSDDVLKSNLGVSDEDDGRAIIDVGGSYVPWRNEFAELLIGYEFYQSLHFDLEKFNLQDHRPTAQVAFRTDRARFGLAATYDYYLLETDSFLQSVQTVPWLTFPEGAFGRTEIFYRMRWRGFYPDAFETFLDAWNHSAGARQLFYLGNPQRYGFLGYRFDREDPIHSEGNVFAYDGHEIGAGAGWLFPFDVSAELEFLWRHENYATTRVDHEYRLAAAVAIPIVDHLSAVLGYFAVFNDSNESLYEYDRHIASVSFRAVF